jgi:site-specific DNA recombinase
MANVALYARVSSEQQADAGTIRSQVSSLLEKIAADGVSLPTTELQFVDEGYSGATLIRPALERLRDGIFNGAVDCVYVHSPDRLARKYAYQILLMDEFQKGGAKIVFLNRKIGDTPEDDLLLQVQGMMAEYERAKILERSRRGKLQSAKRGSVNVLGGAPYGYHYIGKHDGNGDARYEIIFEEARIVQQVFEWIGRDRLSIGEVKRRLDEAGAKTRSGKTFWDRSVIWAMLKNTAYIGKAAFGKTKLGDKRSRLRPQKNSSDRPRQSYSTYDVPQEQWIFIPVPPLVSQELFDAVHEQLSENRLRNREHYRGATHLLQGLICCKSCGYAFYGKPVSNKSAKGKTRTYAYYRCIGTDAYRFGGKRICENKQVRTDLVDDLVWKQVAELLHDPRRLEKEYNRRLTKGPKEAPERLEADRKILQNKISRMIDSYADGLISKEEFEPRVKRNKAQLAKLNEQCKILAEQENNSRQLQLLIVRLDEFAAKLKGKIDKLDWETKRQIIRSLVKSVEVDHERVNVVFRVDALPFELAPVGGQSLQHCNKRDYTNLRLTQRRTQIGSKLMIETPI